MSKPTKNLKEQSLLNAVKNSDTKAVENILTNLGKVNINFLDESGITPLMRAVYQESTPLVSVLIDNGADVNLPAKVDGAILTPIMRAVFQRNAELVEILMKSDNLVLNKEEIIDGMSYTPYHRALYQEDYNIASLIGESSISNT